MLPGQSYVRTLINDRLKRAMDAKTFDRSEALTQKLTPNTGDHDYKVFNLKFRSYTHSFC